MKPKKSPTIPILIYVPVSSTPFRMVHVYCKPDIGDKMHFIGNNYEVRDVTHFPLGGEELDGYEKYNFPFTRVMLSYIRV